MRVIASVAIMAAAALGMAAPAHAAQSITGSWYTVGKRALVTIAPCGKVLCGRISRLIEPTKSGVTTDVNNPDPALKTRKLVGLPILSDFVADGDKWRGKIYDPNTGKTYRSIVSPAKGGTLKVEGCIAMFCQTQTWTAAK
ncbi:DUF2147 domain-containing protein [Blastomonas sp.]|uniref:DUF2147 domain-containing protein n=1 Tax=Blastomonas sp. TaxID=1909299 RepID=UPI00391D0422